jgi:hypothetical protein
MTNLSLFIWTSLVPVLLWEKDVRVGSSIHFFWLVYFGTHNRENGPDLICNKWSNYIFIHMHHMAQNPHLMPLSSTWWPTSHTWFLVIHMMAHKPHFVPLSFTWWPTSHTRVLYHPHDGTQATLGYLVIHMMAHKPHLVPLSSTWWLTSHTRVPCHPHDGPQGTVGAIIHACQMALL